VTAVVLVGGFGTRLRPLTFSIPKPLLPVGERPLLGLILDHLRECEFSEVVLATGYQAELIHAYCGDGSRFGLAVTYVHEDEPLGTAGPLAAVRDAVREDDDDILLMNGDILTSFDLRKLREFRREQDLDLAVAYTRHVYESPFGVLTVRGADVVEIREKPKLEQCVSAGIYALARDVAELVPARTHFTMPQLIGTLLADGRRVGGIEIDDVWLGLEGVAQFEEAVRQVEALAAPSDPSGSTG
jgi:NDP-sugar pyrophosphorylase family protein